MPVLVLVLLIIFFSGLIIRTYNELKNFLRRAPAPRRRPLLRRGRDRLGGAGAGSCRCLVARRAQEG